MKRYSMEVRLIAALAAFALIAGACSKKLPEETYPPETIPTVEITEVVETTEEPTEPSEEPTEESTEETTKETESKHGPFSTAVVTDKAVDLYGQLRVEGKNLVSSTGEPVQLKGMSTYGLNSIGNVFNEDFIATLAQDWGCTVVRLAMYTRASANGEAYIKNPDKYFQDVCDYIDLCVKYGVYVIVDWHILFDGDPLRYKEESKEFFSKISAIYGDCPNIIYEICNEPNGKSDADPDQDVGWENCIKPYAEEVIPMIRENDPDNIIIVGTPNWSSAVEDAAASPLAGDNLMYTYHFYAASVKQEGRDRVKAAIDKGLPIFCTEWGTSSDSGGGSIDIESSTEWVKFFEENNISWCNWSIGGAVSETSNALKFSSKVLSIQEKYQGHWPDEFISRSGLFARAMILGQEYVEPADN